MHVLAQSSIFNRSSCSIQQLSGELICLYKRQSSANKLQEDATQLSRSLIYIKKAGGREQCLEERH